MTVPVRKFRSLAEADSSEPATGDAGENLRAVFELIAVCHELRPIEPRRGVWRYAAVDATQPAPPRAADRDRPGDVADRDRRRDPNRRP